MSSPWYTDIIFVLQHLQVAKGMERTRDIFLKQKASRFFILEGKLYWKERGGVLLNCVDEQEEKRLIEEFRARECGCHHYWKATINKIMRTGFYCPTIFSDTHKKVVSYHKFQIFEGKRKLSPFPLKPI